MKTENYFLNCHSLESIKIRFRDLSKKYHPDKTGDDPEALKIMQTVSDQRDEAIKRVMIKGGKSEAEIEDYIKVFVTDLATGTLNKNTMENIAEHLDKKYNGKATLGDVMKEVFSGFFSTPGHKKFKPGHDPKQID